MVFHWRLSDSKSPQVSRTLLSILAVFNNAVVWMVFIQPPTSKSPRSFNNPLVTVPKVPITIGIIVTFMFHRVFFQLSSKVEVLISLFTFYQFYSLVCRDSKVDNFADFLFFFVDFIIIIIIIIIHSIVFIIYLFIYFFFLESRILSAEKKKGKTAGEKSGTHLKAIAGLPDE